MYKLIRRISSSFFPRPDRPWSEDATSTAPVIGRKRRNSSIEPDESDERAVFKRNRTDSADVEEGPSSSPQREESPSKDGEGVKEVTEGVREVEIDDKKDTPEVPAEAAASVPLPESPELKAQKEPSEEKDVPEVAAEKATSQSAEADTENITEVASQEAPKFNEPELVTTVEEKEASQVATTKKIDVVQDASQEGEVHAS
ncbi:unnamed protein product [Somion occarium]|uniref:Uncharacterized protein n=1 Tax=Somion occarium TaxID=3059160 RepID=A0ABP1DPX1_9APHY